jgi:uncharacterized membrane protein
LKGVAVVTLEALTKSPLQSLTITSAAVAILVQILAIFGIQIAPEEAEAIGASINSIVTVVLLVVTIYGRWRATRAIAIAPPDKAY